MGQIAELPPVDETRTHPFEKACPRSVAVLAQVNGRDWREEKASPKVLLAHYWFAPLNEWRIEGWSHSVQVQRWWPMPTPNEGGFPQ